ncbi:MAG TPA: hypothetical protein VGP07_11280 [Polyangia bacterium]|jgi:hypothetical protein
MISTEARLLFSTAALLFAGCGASGSSSAAGDIGGFAGFKGGGGGAPSGRGGNGGASSADAGTTGPDLPPEQEIESSFQVPVATGRYVWVANPTSGRVAYIDATTLAVQTVEAGNAPTTLASVPGATDEVIVLNVLSHDATVLRATAGQLTSVMVPDVAPLANAWALSPDGHFALAWTNSRVALADPTRAKTLEGFQDVTAIDLTAAPPTATTLAVGYRPVSITFSADDSQAYVVTGDGVSVLGLPAAGGAVKVVRDVPLTDDPTEDPDTRDVSVTTAGRAVVRREGSADVRIVDLTTGALGKVTLSGAVTDLDVTADGTRAIAVVRETAEVAILPLATAADDPSTVLSEIITGETIGSVVLTADARQAILFSNATATERLTVVDLGTGTYHLLRVHAPVLSILATPDGQYGIVLHQAPASSGTADNGGAGGNGGGGNGGAGGGAVPPQGPLVVANAFSVVPLDGSRAGRIQETTAPPTAVAISPASDRTLVTVRDDVAHRYGAYVVGIPALDITTLALASPPIATGVVAAANRGYVAQSHPEGRITFIPFEGGAPQTLTGFDLGARVVDGVTP